LQINFLLLALVIILDEFTTKQSIKSIKGFDVQSTGKCYHINQFSFCDVDLESYGKFSSDQQPRAIPTLPNLSFC
jgi:hypothetical protein